MAEKKASFPKMSEIKTPEGAEGWQEIYASYHIPGELKEEEDNSFWFLDSIHKPKVVYPFDTYDMESWGRSSSETSSWLFEIPATLGCDQRIVNGYLYVHSSTINDPELIKQRLKVFTERADFYFNHWTELLELRKARIYEMNRTLENLDFSWPTKEESEKHVYDITSQIKIPPGLRIISNYNKLIDLIYEAWAYHFEFCNPGYAAYLGFYDFCKQHFPDISDIELSGMVSGVTVEMYKPQEYLIELTELAAKLNLQDTFLKFKGLSSEKLEEFFKVLKETEEGKSWIKRLDEIKDPWFNVSTGRGYTWTEYTWLDDLSIPIGVIIEYLERTEQGKSIVRPLAEVEERRDKLVTVYRSLFNSDQDRDIFDKLREVAVAAYQFVEGHQFYLDNWFHQAMYHAVKRLGKTIRDSGLIDDVNDIFYLHRFELSSLVYETMVNYAVGFPVSNGDRWRAKIEKRKKIMAVLEKWQPPPALGPVPEKVTDPNTRMLWGVTSETIDRWQEQMGAAGTGESNIIKGVGGSPGTVVGRARVITDVSQIGELQEGEILVAPSTEPSWSYAFVKIAGTVTDIGGVMSHAAIVCREYGLPAVTGVGFGTRVIKSGQMIEVRGDEGIVRILDKGDKE